MTESAFIQAVNQWFEENPRIRVTSCRFQQGRGIGVLTQQDYLNAMTITYTNKSPSGQAQRDGRYCLAALRKMGLMECPAEDLLRQWQEENPTAVILKSTAVLHQRSSGYAPYGIGANNLTQVYLLFWQPAPAEES